MKISGLHPAFGRFFGVLLVMALALLPLFPGRVAPLSAPAEEFSAQRALVHLPIIAESPHPSGSPAQQKVRAYLVEQLTGLGLETEVQKGPGLENVTARLRGSDPSGAIVILAHYDSYGGPGAADNGAGISALLEIMRAFTAGPRPCNDIIALFDDSEELPDAFSGTKYFIRYHPWMADVRVAIGMDTAVRGFIATDDTGPDNGWMVNVLARSYTNGAWTSLSGGGQYDTQPFRDAGIRVLELEDNYPFVEQHTPQDVPAIVKPGSLQQLGEQALRVAREIGGLDLEQTSGPQQTYLFIPFLGLLHYPQTWALPLAIVAGVLLITAFGLALWRKVVTWRGWGVALLVTFITAGLTALCVNAVWKAAPQWLGWKTQAWLDWPEVIPPNGWLILITGYGLIVGLTALVYRFARRWSSLAGFSFAGLFVFYVLALALAVGEPKAAILPTWPVLTGAAVWLAAFAIRTSKPVPVVWVAFIAALPTALYILPLLISVFMSDGTKSVAITSAAWVFYLAILLPGVDDLVTRMTVRPEAVTKS